VNRILSLIDRYPQTLPPQTPLQHDAALLQAALAGVQQSSRLFLGAQVVCGATGQSPAAPQPQYPPGRDGES
jgi:hypothetical protein